MSPGKRLLAVTLAALALGVANGRAQAPARQPKALLELFTSQGCSSCPPADALVIELSKDPDLIALTLPVTYWDYLGWKDTLGKDSFAKRQKFYAKARGDGQVYTPQVVVNGTGHLVGSDKDEIEKTIQQLAPSGFPVRVALREADGNLEIKLAPAGAAAEGAAGVWVLPTTHLASVPVTRGENQGKTLSYANVVRGMVRVGEWNGREATITAPLSATQAPEADGYVVIVQTEQPGKYGMMPGPILGAARSKPAR
ncbi:MAG: DUF1223 domain-containing protein [Bosea sp.]|uniref:DUF1223 domain-containing protein n=1 Tax=unclassified Bosea (in: a-proteobacteria) TaxID=2653178 RepID=UPI00095AFFE3|nr:MULTISPECIES: DUF1223 domain-containing protein [unclassified Bosea (in: a-proteobacteria)]MBN9459464.1 DUF1223 domain-containing protein [Bosea sp. (in: a-proteobacteria)]OJV11866.1 MAG: hypothetical protein BGO20_20165 [Bosea sp. 67-29]